MTKTGTTAPISTLLYRLLLGSGLIAIALQGIPAHAGKIKCWTNSDGIRECGNVLPPEYAQKGHDELNAQGVRTKHHERALSAEEIAERQRIKDEEIAKQQAIEEKQRQDHILLSTFANEDEIVMARNGKITSIRTEMRLTRKSLTNSQERLLSLRKQAANLERAGKPVPANVTMEISQAQKQIEDYEKFLQTKLAEQEKINTQFDKDMYRFQELRKPRKTATTPAVTAAPAIETTKTSR